MNNTYLVNGPLLFVIWPIIFSTVRLSPSLAASSNSWPLPMAHQWMLSLTITTQIRSFHYFTIHFPQHYNFIDRVAIFYKFWHKWTLAASERIDRKNTLKRKSRRAALHISLLSANDWTVLWTGWIPTKIFILCF